MSAGPGVSKVCNIAKHNDVCGNCPTSASQRNVQLSKLLQVITMMIGDSMKPNRALRPLCIYSKLQNILVQSRKNSQNVSIAVDTFLKSIHS
jgi:hypothetical protein